MKRYLILLLTLLLLTGCSQSTNAGSTVPVATNGAEDHPGEAATELPTEAPQPVYVFDDGVTLWESDLCGLTAQQAYDALLPRLKTYVLELTLNGRILTLTAEDMGMELSLAALEDWCAGRSDGKDAVTLSDDAILASISSQADMPAKNAGLEFQGKNFVLTREECGTAVEPTEALAAVKAAAAELAPTAVAAGEIRETYAAMPMDSEEARAALNKANSYLDLSLTYTFDTLDGKPNSYTLTRSDIASVLSFSEELDIGIDEDGALNVAGYMNFKYYIPGEKGWFVTTDGRTIESEVTYASQVVDMELLREDIAYCVSNKISGTRPATYRAATQHDMPYGGHYIEIDQNAQTVWLYKGGQCILTTPTVTGNRAYHWYTPNGVFAINRKGEHVMLNGETYVRYWMCFRGNNYGLHDASWRDEFGGDIYMKNGSHGCVNLPKEAAEFMFSHVYVGTPVIIYRDPTVVDTSTPTEG